MSDKKHYVFGETHEHPEGGDRGGYAEETHTFLVNEDGSVTHEYDLCCGDGDPSSFGLDETTLDRLTTKEAAVGFVDAMIDELKSKLANLEECKAALLSAERYEDVSEYDGYEDGDEDGED